LHPEDAGRAGIKAGDEVAVVLDGVSACARAAIDAGIARGLAALPAGIAPFEAFAAPAWCKISRVQ
jgi:anaerobic selenocysteine-containing dehydrogenase